MNVTLEELHQWMAMPSENEHLEFKEAKNNFHFETLVKYCCALANERGGRIILGVSDKPPRKVVGTGVFKSPERTIAGLIERLHLKIDMDEVAHPDGRVLVFHVPSRPLGMAIQVNAVCHRDYRLAGSIFIRQFPSRIEIVSPGGFPEGITTENLLYQQSPRNRRIAETQRSFCVDDFLVLDYLRTSKTVADSLKYRLPKLLESGVIERIGRGRGIRYILSKKFYEFTDRKGTYTRRIGLDRETNKELIIKHIHYYKKGSLNEFHQVLPNLSRHQIYSLLKSLKTENRIKFIGSKRGGYWEL